MPTAQQTNDLVTISESPFCAETAPAQLAHPITPADAHYVRSNFEVPPASSAWSVHVDGAVRDAFALDLAELRAMSHHAVTFTMECAGNDRTTMRPVPAGEAWRTGAVSTATWSGVPLVALLQRAGLRDSAVEIAVEGADSGSKPDAGAPITFCRSLPLSELTPDVLLAIEMNGEALPAAHGGPLRLVVPGWYGMASVKWVRRISAIETPFAGYFQAQRYVYEYGDEVVPVTRTRVKSVVVEPGAGGTVRAGTTVEAWGWAWSGEGDVTEVRVHGDSSDEWQLATLDAPLSAHAWRRWRCDLRFERRGRYTLRTRATDAAGNAQPEVARWNRLGYGNNAVREVAISAE